jgi:hypothetical protein
MNSSDNDFIEVSLGGMGYSHSHTKRLFQNVSLLVVDSKSEFLKINILQFVMFQNVLVDLKILKEKQISSFFSMYFGIFVSFQKTI